MKLIIVLCFILFSITCYVSADAEEQGELAWKEYKAKFNKSYPSETEDAYRKKIFLDNREYILSHNLKSKGSSYIQGLNHLSDMTQEEINHTLNGFRLDKEPERHMDGILWTILLSLNDTLSTPTDRAWYENIFSPSMMDYRTTGRVSKIKDQGSCGSCWAFATTGALESLLASQGKAVLLSEQNLVDCSSRYGNHGCSGGLVGPNSFNYIRDHGIMSQQDYPYTGKDESCKYIKEKSVISVRGSVILPHGNEPLLRLALSMTGPIPVAIDASRSSFHSYKSGIYNDRGCRSSTNSLNHAVLLVGYGTDKNYGDYWIIKNSWGLKWGDNGYMKMARNLRNLCGVATYAVLPIP